MPTLPTLSAFGVGLGVGALCTTTALRSFFISDSFGAGDCPHPATPPGRGVGGRVRRSGVSVDQAAVLSFCSGVRPPSDPWGRTLKELLGAGAQR